MGGTTPFLCVALFTAFNNKNANLICCLFCFCSRGALFSFYHRNGGDSPEMGCCSFKQHTFWTLLFYYFQKFKSIRLLFTSLCTPPPIQTPAIEKNHGKIIVQARVGQYQNPNTNTNTNTSKSLLTIPIPIPIPILGNSS